jgi:hypothetical protein
MDETFEADMETGSVTIPLQLDMSFFPVFCNCIQSDTEHGSSRTC